MELIFFFGTRIEVFFNPSVHKPFEVPSYAGHTLVWSLLRLAAAVC